MNVVTATALEWAEAGRVPDSILRQGIRSLIRRKRETIRSRDPEFAARVTEEFIATMNESPIAPLPRLANEQHYELPASFFREVLGNHLKYSCCYWARGVSSLTAAESTALAVTVDRAGIRDGMRILDLGCGWGSLSLSIAERFPGSSVLAVSNSRGQHDAILERAAARKITNLRVRVADMNDFSADERFDRIVSVEMFEHMRNYRELFGRVANWLTPDGRFFMHIFTHATTPYAYEDNGPTDWMSRHFFSGGMMPSAELPLRFQRHLAIERQWRWNGMHYTRTCNAWLQRMDHNRDHIMPILRDTYGEEEAERWWMRWRMFFMACAELFAWDGGREWFVSHYRFRRA